MVRGIGIKAPISDAGMQTYRQVKKVARQEGRLSHGLDVVRYTA